MAGTFTTEGMNEVLDDALGAGIYVGLVDNSGFSAYAEGDTAAQIGGTNGWSEFTTYSDATRIAYSPAAASGGVLTNSASTADFSINGSGTVLGAFLIDDSTKDGTSGNLIGEGDFSGGTVAVVNGNTLKVTVQGTLTDNT